jgi:hypothetical protein
MCTEQVEKGKSEAPFYYIMPVDQHDRGELVNLVNLMKEHGIEVYTLKDECVLDGRLYARGDVVIPLAQPFRAFIKEVMVTQEYPERHYTPGGELIEPYDITSWSLPLHRSITSLEIDTRSEKLEGMLSPIQGRYDLSGPFDTEVHAMVLTVNSNESFRTAFRALAEGFRVERLQEDEVIKAETFGKGSFVIYYDSKKKEGWEALLDELPFQSGLVSDKRAMKTVPVTVPRIALVETYFHDMDAGWTRYLFDTYHVPFTVLHPDQFPGADLAGGFDVIIFPDNDKSILMTGKRKSGESYYLGSYHPDYVKGIEEKGMENLMTFSDQGGIIIAWGRSANLFEGVLKIKHKDTVEEFQLPFRDISDQLAKNGLQVPGSLMKLNVVQGHPLTLGMPEQIGVFSRGRPVFETSVPVFDMDRRVIGTYPEKDVLLSGYSAKDELMGNKAAMIWLKKGKGQYVLYGFGPQFRASTQASYKLLFNALLLSREN